VTTENQDILWRMLQQHPQFYNMEFSQKNELFRKTIETIYFENEHVQQLNYQQLQELNKKAIRGILDRIIQPTNKIVVESSEDRSVREFREREEVYQKMTKKPDLPDAKKMFEEPLNDDVILNMDERLQQYQSQRSLDISNIEVQQNQHQSMEELVQRMKELEQRVAVLEKDRLLHV